MAFGLKIQELDVCRGTPGYKCKCNTLSKGNFCNLDAVQGLRDSVMVSQKCAISKLKSKMSGHVNV